MKELGGVVGTAGLTDGASMGVEVGVGDGPACIVIGSIAMSTEGISVED